MPYNKPHSNNYFGFVPVDANARVNLYLVSSSEANQISMGDVVVYATDKGTVRVATGSASTDLGLMVGVAASVVVANGGSTAASLVTKSSQNVLVYDDPNCLFVGCDTTSGVIGVGTNVGKAYCIVSTGVIGSTGVNTTINRSVQALSGVTASSGSAIGYRFRVIGMHKLESALSTVASATAATSSEVRKWIVKPEFHANIGAGIGYAHLTT